MRRMPQYFFDTRDNGRCIPDENGLELADLEAVKRIAARSLAELALDVLHVSSERVLVVDVRDEHDRTVPTTELTFKAEVRKQIG